MDILTCNSASCNTCCAAGQPLWLLVLWDLAGSEGRWKKTRKLRNKTPRGAFRFGPQTRNCCRTLRYPQTSLPARGYSIAQCARFARCVGRMIYCSSSLAFPFNCLPVCHIIITHCRWIDLLYICHRFRLSVYLVSADISGIHTRMCFFPVVSRTHSPKCSIACDQLPTSSFSICSTKGSAASISLACVTWLQIWKNMEIWNMNLALVICSIYSDLFHLNLNWGGSLLYKGSV